MKKNKYIIGFTVFLFLISTLGGIYYVKNQEKKQEQDKYFTEQEKRVEIFLKFNTPEFKSIKFTKRDVSPMGIPYIEGYINDDKTLDFSADVEPNDHNFEGSLGMSTKLREMMNVDLKNYSEIIKEEKNER